MSTRDLFPEVAPAKNAREPWTPKQYKVVCLRECPTDAQICDTPAKVAEYYQSAIITDPRWNPDTETLVVIMLNARRRVIGHHVVSNGLVDSLLVHPREVFRAAIIANAYSIVMLHNHPSGDSTPSEPDIRASRDMIRAGQLLKIEVCDSMVFGRVSPENPRGWHSLRELGYFYT
jgi:DNA repair protein RadC